jgi:hypothetical protein
MDWVRAVDINRVALKRIVAEIMALIGFVAGGTVQRLPHAIYRSVERLLQPTESALRRLIVIAARGLVVKPLPKRAMPQGFAIASNPTGRMAFRLFDTRKTFDFNQPENPLFIKVETYENNPFNLFNGQAWSRSDEPAESVSAVHLSRRLAAVVHALETLPQQARRLARWQLRRKNLKKPKFICALRPGLPPGHQTRPKAEIDHILQECHWLAWDSMRLDST